MHTNNEFNLFIPNIRLECLIFEENYLFPNGFEYLFKLRYKALLFTCRNSLLRFLGYPIIRAPLKGRR